MGQKNGPYSIGDRINEGFFYKKMYGRFAGQPKKEDIITRWPYYQVGHTQSKTAIYTVHVVLL